MGFNVTDFDFDTQNTIWLLASITDSLDIDLGSGTEIIRTTNHPDFTGTYAQAEMVLLSLDHQFNLLDYEHFACYGPIKPLELSIVNNNVWLSANYLSNIEVDTLVFNQDTAFISPTNDRQLMIHLDTLMNFQGALILDQQATINAICAVDDELLFSGTPTSTISGLVDSTFTSSNSNFTWGRYDGTSIYYYNSSVEYWVKGKRKGRYLLNQGNQMITLKSVSNETLQNIKPIGYNSLSYGVTTLLQNKVSEELGFFGRFYFDLNVGTIDRPLTLHGPDLGTKHDVYFGMLASAGI